MNTLYNAHKAQCLYNTHLKKRASYLYLRFNNCCYYKLLLLKRKYIIISHVFKMLVHTSAHFILERDQGAMSWFSRLVAGLSQRRPRLDPWPVHLARGTGTGSSPSTSVSPVSVIAPVLLAHSYIYCGHYVVLATGSVITKQTDRHIQPTVQCSH